MQTRPSTLILTGIEVLSGKQGKREEQVITHDLARRDELGKSQASMMHECDKGRGGCREAEFESSMDAEGLTPGSLRAGAHSVLPFLQQSLALPFCISSCPALLKSGLPPWTLACLPLYAWHS